MAKQCIRGRAKCGDVLPLLWWLFWIPKNRSQNPAILSWTFSKRTRQDSRLHIGALRPHQHENDVRKSQWWSDNAPGLWGQMQLTSSLCYRWRIEFAEAIVKIVQECCPRNFTPHSNLGHPQTGVILFYCILTKWPHLQQGIHRFLAFSQRQAACLLWRELHHEVSMACKKRMIWKQ